MLPVRHGEMRQLNTLQREFDDLFNRIFGIAEERKGDLATVAIPAVNSYIRDGRLHLEAELPGVEAGQLDVRIDGPQVIISGERRSGHTEEKADFLLHESRVATFERCLTLPEGADGEQAKASYHDGLLEITMPMTKAKAAGGRKLAIEGLESEKKSKKAH